MSTGRDTSSHPGRLPDAPSHHRHPASGAGGGGGGTFGTGGGTTHGPHVTPPNRSIGAVTLHAPKAEILAHVANSFAEQLESALGKAEQLGIRADLLQAEAQEWREVAAGLSRTRTLG